MTVATLMLDSCATFISGVNQDIYVNTEPQGAAIYVNGKDQGVLTPATIAVKRRKQTVYTFQKQGYEDGTVIQQGSLNSVVFGNILLGGVVGLAVDASTGAMWQYNNTSVFYQFNATPYAANPFIHSEKPVNILSRSDLSETALEDTNIQWNFSSVPGDARIFWRVISNVPDQVKNTIERYLATLPYKDVRPLNIPGLTYENSSDVVIEIKIVRTGYNTQIKTYNVRQVINEKEISDFFELVKNDKE